MADEVDVEEGRRLLAAATEGPWMADHDLTVEFGSYVLSASKDWPDGSPYSPADGCTFDDANLICWLRNNADALLTSAALAEDVVRLREALEGSRSLLVRLTSEAALRNLTPEIVVAAALDDLLDHLGHCNDPAHCHIMPPGPGTRGGVGDG
jgi:hypothetical protein